MAFSGALTLTDLNDYLGPSQACIKPVNGAPEAESNEPQDAQSTNQAAAASTQIAIDQDGSYYESANAHASSSSKPSDAKDESKPRARTKLETAEISLNDCLACSGCVTSAESVLITMQSQDELRRAVKEIHDSGKPKLLVASVSPQSLASLSATYSFQRQQQQTAQNTAATASGSTATLDAISLPVLLHRISYFLKSAFGFDYVFDTTFARHIALKQHEAEFFERRNNTLKRKRTSSATASEGSSSAPTLPMLASACPGWICYAEKTHGELIPYISTTKSPQQVAGVLAKKFLAERLGMPPTSDPDQSPAIYHATIMPCYDKKLEASRPDFFDELTQSKEVDCVLTTGELDKLMLEEGFDIQSPVPGEEEALQHSIADLSLEQVLKGASVTGSSQGADGQVAILPHFPQMLDQPGSSSGGYLFNLMRAVWLEWLSQHWDSFPDSIRQSGVLPKLNVNIIRTSDFTEFILRAPVVQDHEGQNGTSTRSTILFKGAHCYGFRNLQNLVRKVQKQTGARNARGAAGRLVDADGNAVANTSSRGRATRGRGRGMVRRGRGGAAGAAGVVRSSPLNPDADVAMSGELTNGVQEEVDEDRGYDYVEVMACPSGCVNGGGQLRPPVGAELESSSGPKAPQSEIKDPEGYERGGWVASQSQASDEAVEDITMMNVQCKKGKGQGDQEDSTADGAEEKEVKGWQGTSKEWVRRVEQAYWQGSKVAHMPVSSAAASCVSGTSTPVRGGGGGDAMASGASTPASQIKSIRLEDHQKLLNALPSIAQSDTPTMIRSNGNASNGSNLNQDKVGPDSLAYADVLASLIVKELSVLTASSPTDDASIEEARNKLFRTQYRAIQDEAVNGLAVQW